MSRAVQLCTVVCSVQSADLQVHAPRFSKAKQEGWWVVLGEADSGELLALKRVGGIKGCGRASLALSASSEPCHKLLSLYLISDCYFGLDQQYELPLHFTADQVT